MQIPRKKNSLERWMILNLWKWKTKGHKDFCFLFLFFRPKKKLNEIIFFFVSNTPHTQNAHGSCFCVCVCAYVFQKHSLNHLKSNDFIWIIYKWIHDCEFVFFFIEIFMFCLSTHFNINIFFSYLFSHHFFFFLICAYNVCQYSITSVV